MSYRGFSKRLSQELPRWEDQGWVSAEGRRAILADIAARQPNLAWASWLALSGALLLGVGVITWFAAHWNEMSKLIKLVLIFVALAASHGAHGYCRIRAAMPKLAQGLVFLSVLLFGAAIMLVGQIYHIDAHFPDGLALWAAGGLLTAWLLESQAAGVASIGLAALWTGTEQFDYQSMNWPLLGYLPLAVVPIFRGNWTIAARAWGALCVFWMIGWHAQPWFGEAWAPHAHVRLFAIQLLAIAGFWALSQASEHPFARALRAGFLLVALIGAFAFTFPDFARMRPATTVGDPTPWLAAFAGSAAIYAAGIIRLVRISELSAARLGVGIALAVGFAVLLGVEVVLPRSGSLQALCWNGIFLGMLYGMGDLGIRRGDRALVNRAFTAFAIWVLARYFDAFWSLFDRSLFFMAGGALLLAGGGWLERRRRSLLRDIGGGGQP